MIFRPNAVAAYRYFADKEDLLFAEDEAWRADLRSAISQQPAGEPPFSVLRGASATVARALEDRREEVRRRGEVIASAAALTARERAKHAAGLSVAYSKKQTTFIVCSRWSRAARSYTGGRAPWPWPCAPLWRRRRAAGAVPSRS